VIESLGSRLRAELLRSPAIVGATGLAAAALLHLRDPHDAGSYGYCPFLALTGRPCPGCGGLRAVNDLTHGDVMGAVSSNVLAVALVGVVGVAWLLWAVRSWRGEERPMIALSTRTGLVVVAVFVLFGVIRNTPWGAALAP
jgi:uncharacterized protein DUF2752